MSRNCYITPTISSNIHQDDSSENKLIVNGKERLWERKKNVVQDSTLNPRVWWGNGQVLIPTPLCTLYMLRA